MAAHHTKDKGDLGVAKAVADLVSKGYLVLLPLTEHAPFDLVAYGDARFERVQVKYRTLQPTGAVYVRFGSSWADRHGSHARRLDKEEVDIVCIYCPDTDRCYYLRPQSHGSSVTLRISPSRNRQQVGVLLAEHFRDMPE